MSINISEVIWTIICFFVLLFVLKTFLFGPLTRHMDARRARIDAGLDEARRADQAREEARLAADENWHARTDEADAMVKEGKLLDEKQRARALEEARDQSARALREARSQTDREEEEAREAVSRKGDELARTLADRLLSSGEEG